MWCNRHNRTLGRCSPKILYCFLPNLCSLLLKVACHKSVSDLTAYYASETTEENICQIFLIGALSVQNLKGNTLETLFSILCSITDSLSNSTLSFYQIQCKKNANEYFIVYQARGLELYYVI